MSDAFDPTLGLEENLRQIASAQLAAAIQSARAIPGDPHKAIHAMRKRIKFLRGLLRLARPGLGAAGDQANADLRRVARLFSELRDLQVMERTAERLCLEAGDKAALVAPLCHWATAEYNAALARARLGKWSAQAEKRLVKVQGRVAGWHLGGDPADILHAGLRDTIRRAAGDMKTIRRNGSIEAFHDWRRQVKYHRYHLDLLQPARPQELVSRIALADRIGESLGDDHDMSELIARLRRAPRNAVPKKTRRYAEKLAAAVGRRLRDHALEDAPDLFDAKPGALARRLTGWWAQAVGEAAAHPVVVVTPEREPAFTR